MLQAYALPGFHEVLAADPPEIGIVQDQIRQFRALLDEVNVRQALHFCMKIVKANKLAENDSRVVKTECLVEIAGQKILLLSHRDLLLFLPTFCGRELNERLETPHTFTLTLEARGGLTNNCDGCYAWKRSINC